MKNNLKKTKEEKLELKEWKKGKKRFFKWLKKKRKAYLKFFKSWAPWDTFYLYSPIKMILQDMYEYYKKGDNVVGIPVVTDENGAIIEKDDRATTLFTALELIRKYEEMDDSVTTMDAWKEAHKVLIEAYAYIADNMDSWWD